MSYATYICGTQAVFYDTEVLKSLKNSMLFWWRLSYRYQSLWRVLHIDGFEGYLWNRSELPKHQGYQIQFFQYENNA
jgi:hypothetical protein